MDMYRIWICVCIEPHSQLISRELFTEETWLEPLLVDLIHLMSQHHNICATRYYLKQQISMNNEEVPKIDGRRSKRMHEQEDSTKAIEMRTKNRSGP